MLKSMTAYANEEKIEGELSVGAEIRSYNSRFLDISLRLPSGFATLEEKVKSLIAAHLTRGRVELRIWIKDASEKACVYEVDSVKANAYVSALRMLREGLNLPGEVTLDHLMSVPGIVQKVENSQAAESYWPLIADCLTQALTTLDQMRREEGRHIGEDFAQRLNYMEEQVDRIEKTTQGMLDHYRDKLQARIEALTKGIVEIDPMRIAQEAALMADRSDISEEIVRARSHIAQFKAGMQGQEPAGRTLNFLLQEFNREFNTMGSKVGQADLSHIVVGLKAEIEKLREQVQNIE